MRVDLTDDDIAYIKLVLYGTTRGREISKKLPNPHHKKMKKKQKAVIDDEPVGVATSKKPYRTEPDYPVK